MKYLVTLLIVFSSFIVKAQLNSDKLIGTWELTEFSFKDQAVVPQLHGFKRYKMYTQTNFAVFEINLQNNTISTSFFGTYTLTDSTYNEHILHANTEASRMIGGNYAAIIRFDKEEAMAMIANINGGKMDERWKKVKNSPLADFDK